MYYPTLHVSTFCKICEIDEFPGKVMFVQLAYLLNIQVITVKSRPHPLETWLPSLYLSSPSRLLLRMVQHRYGSPKVFPNPDQTGVGGGTNDLSNGSNMVNT